MANFKMKGHTVLNQTGTDTPTWGTGAPTGAIINVQQVVKNGTQQVTSTSYVLLTGLTIDITPKSSNNKFLTFTFEYYANSPSEVIDIYKGLEFIDNIISL